MLFKVDNAHGVIATSTSTSLGEQHVRAQMQHSRADNIKAPFPNESGVSTPPGPGRRRPSRGRYTSSPPNSPASSGISVPVELCTSGFTWVREKIERADRTSFSGSARTRRLVAFESPTPNTEDASLPEVAVIAGVAMPPISKHRRRPAIQLQEIVTHRRNKFSTDVLLCRSGSSSVGPDVTRTSQCTAKYSTV